MSAGPPELDEADRWEREAREDLRTAEVIAAHDELPDRAAGFHAHLAAEKALKALLIRRRIPAPRIHDLIGLRAMLGTEDADAFDLLDLELLNPWTIEGRYPADLPDDAELDEVLAAARRVVDAGGRAGE
jgi:HEPN domain-containing protein